ncbi:Translation machinery-associated protein 22 [Thoreauomyces humboldtii]|nr:Translation machinery-associated protein 22 [Thoreauomyces humboldtii]
MSDTETAPAEVQDWPKTRVLTDILYCGSCTLPVEYCEFAGKNAQCQKWLRKKDADLFVKIWPEAGLSEKLDAATLNGDEAEGKDAAASKEQRRADAKAAQEEKRLATRTLVIKRVERNKRKCVIEVSGLELFGVDLKKAAKLFAGKFATGSSVTKNPQGGEDIVVQGDVQDDIYDLVLATWKDVPEEQIELTEGKKK